MALVRGLTVVVVAAYPAARAGLRALVESSGVAGSVLSVSPGALGGAEGAPDAVLADIEDTALVETIEEVFAGTPIVYLLDEPFDFGVGSARGRGFLSRDAEEAEIGAALTAVANGLHVSDPKFVPYVPSLPQPAGGMEALTAREFDVLRLLATGIPNKLIARELGISEHTAKYHVGEILGKLGAASRTEAVLTAVRQGLLPL